ncbi:MAG: LysM peptidoglycan-binding domain-containing protein [Candidatus Cloacimonetes bacterium]|jgi:membrane-bound lytic murein transglycosylase D|nr:LysM peptidoglycan-binding domain-containing protein [Candidatus Cloacimonadota bacterium]MDD4156481.1 LysM peptidoglycan-binding domain-containing protein [Candidatus Cloacimonadota bacterium]
MNKNMYLIKTLSIMLCLIGFVSLINSCYLIKSVDYTNQTSAMLDNNAISNQDSLSTISELDSLNNLLEIKNIQIDSLNNLLSEYFFIVDSLRQEIEITYSKVLINDTFEIPTSYTFAGVDIDLTNDRIRTRLINIFESEVKKAHQFIPRSGIYFDLMDSILVKHNIHPDIKYLAVAESNLNYMAYSQASAAGIWQFMPTTAKGYNIKIDSYLDERRNIFKSTEAAAKYLLNAHSHLKSKDINDWLLTLASYNTGVGNVLRVAREQKGKDFFSLIMRFDETNNYVWRAIATKIIFEYEEEIFEKKFDRLPPLLETAKLVDLELKGFYDLSEWASAYGTTAGRIWELNPWIKLSQRRVGKYSKINHLIIPAGKYEILVPVESKPDSALVASIEKKFLVKNSSPFLLPGQTIKHKVKKGDTLIGLAKKYSVKVNDIKTWNNLKGNTIYIGQTLLLQGKDVSSGKYIVQSGDTLAQIALKLGVSQKHLMNKNNLQTIKRNDITIVLIKPGQILEY